MFGRRPGYATRIGHLHVPLPVVRALIGQQREATIGQRIVPEACAAIRVEQVQLEGTPPRVARLGIWLVPERYAHDRRVQIPNADVLSLGLHPAWGRGRY